MLCTVFPLVYVLYFEKFLIHNSCGFMILKKIRLNLLGLCYFPLNTLSAGMCRQTDGRTDGRMDGLTDELIWGGLGNLRFLQVKGYLFAYWRVYDILCTFVPGPKHPLANKLFDMFGHHSHKRSEYFMTTKNPAVHLLTAM
jgi:hypothetical protein